MKRLSSGQSVLPPAGAQGTNATSNTESSSDESDADSPRNALKMRRLGVPDGASRSRETPLSASFAAMTTAAPMAAPSFGDKIQLWAETCLPEERANQLTAAERIMSAFDNREDSLDLNQLDLTSLPGCLAEITSLAHFYAEDNQLTELPALPVALAVLRVSTNQITRLPSLPASLTGLYASDNQIDELPNLPAELTYLYVSHNNLSHLPELPPALMELDIGDDEFVLIPVLPDALKQFSAKENYLTQLPALPPALKVLDACRNQLEHLPAFPDTLTHLAASGNQIEDLQVLPPGLEVLLIGNNPIAHLPPLPATLTILHILNSEVAHLPALPASLTELNANPAVAQETTRQLEVRIAALNTELGRLAPIPAPVGALDEIESESELERLPSELINKIEENFEPGSGDAAMASIVNRRFHSRLSQRLDIDKNIKAAHDQIALLNQLMNQFIQQIIAELLEEPIP